MTRPGPRRWALASLLVMLTGGGCVGTALAQSTVLRPAEPGQIERRLERPVTPTAPEPELSPPVPSPGLEITGKPGAFVLTGVDIEGASVYDAAELARLYEPLLAREITLAEVEALLAEITRKYHDDGYLLARAIAPPQSVSLGVLKIRVIEGYVARVVLTGAKPGGQALLDAYAGAIAAQRPLTLAVLEREILLMGDLPGITAHPSILPLDESKGAYELQIDLARDAVAGSAGFDNRGTDSVGPLQAYGTADLNSVFGRLEATGLTLFTVPDQPHELIYGELRHDEPIGTDGARLALSVSRSWVYPGGDLRSFDVNSRALRATVELRYPLVRRRNHSLFLIGRAYWSDNFEDVMGSRAFADRVRAVGGSARYNVIDRLGGNSAIEFGLIAGLPVAGASESGDAVLSRPRGTGRFTKATLDIARQQPISGPWSVYIAAAGQASSAILLSSEEFGLGGARFGRAYDPSEITGSDGAAGAVELRYDGAVTGAGLGIGYQLFGFADYGKVWSDTSVGVSGRNRLASAGLGVRASLPHGLLASTELAFPLARGVTTNANGKNSSRVFFRLTAAF